MILPWGFKYIQPTLRFRWPPQAYEGQTWTINNHLSLGWPPKCGALLKFQYPMMVDTTKDRNAKSLLVWKWWQLAFLSFWGLIYVDIMCPMKIIETLDFQHLPTLKRAMSKQGSGVEFLRPLKAHVGDRVSCQPSLWYCNIWYLELGIAMDSPFSILSIISNY